MISHKNIVSPTNCLHMWNKFFLCLLNLLLNPQEVNKEESYGDDEWLYAKNSLLEAFEWIQW